MTINDFDEEYINLTQEAKVRKFKNILNNILNLIEKDPEQLDYLVEDGILKPLIDIENNDGFGTEGMDI